MHSKCDPELPSQDQRSCRPVAKGFTNILSFSLLLHPCCHPTILNIARRLVLATLVLSLLQLVGGEFDLEMNFIIQEAESIGCMVELLSHCEVTCQAEIWSMFTAILRKSVRNLQTSTEVGLIQQVLLKMSTVDDMIAGKCALTTQPFIGGGDGSFDLGRCVFPSWDSVTLISPLTFLTFLLLDEGGMRAEASAGSWGACNCCP